MKRYEAFAEQIAQLIHDGVLAAGEKLPSVRHASQHYRISPATVFSAYYRLESQGLIEARPRSGYFVREQLPPMPEPQVSMPMESSTEVGVSELVFSVLDSLKDPHTVPFGSAFPCPDLYPLPRLARSMQQALRELPAPAMVSDLTDGNTQLRRQIALRYMNWGVPLAQDELVLTNGAMEALNLCLQSVTKPGDLVAIESPAFYATLQVLERLQLKAVEIPVHPRQGIDLNVLAERLCTLPIKACWFMSSLQNPIGASLTDTAKAQLYQLLEQHQIPLIEDDVYAELQFSGQHARPVKSWDTQGLVMHCGSFSKCLAPGYRVGWVMGGRWTEAIKRQRLMTTIAPSIPAQAALADYLQHGGYDRHLRVLRQTLQRQQEHMLAAIARYFPSETRVTRPSGGYFLWLELPPSVDALQLFRMAMSQGISLAPGPIFSATQGFAHCIRLNHGHPWTEQHEAAMALLGRLVNNF